MSHRIRAVRTACFLTAGLILAALTACRITDIPLWGPVKSAPAAGSYEVMQIRDVAYSDQKDADKVRNTLDLYLPKGKKDFPVVVLVHGGAWVLGDNRCCGLYTSVGEFLASRGIGAALPNYRLSPAVKHPEHIKDLARAVAWTHAHIASYGGRPDQLFLIGHSAGGHLVALLATDEKYLKAHGLSSKDIKGVIGVSGVYRIPAGKTDLFLGGNSPLALRLDAMAPFREASAKAGSSDPGAAGIPVTMDIFSAAFGDNELIRLTASPVHYVRRGLPPFLLLNAEKDLPLLPGMAEEFHRALLKEGCQASIRRIEHRNHNSILFNAIETEDPTARAILDFIAKQQKAAK